MEMESISWYLTDLNVDKGDYLTGMVVTAMMVLKEYLDVSYEDLVKMLPSFRGVLEAGGATRIPHKDTLRKFSARLSEGLLDRVIGETARLMCGPDLVMAVDSTGFSESNASRHFVKRLRCFGTEDRVVRDFAKATFAADTGSLTIVSCDVASSHSADVRRFAPVLELAEGSGVSVSNSWPTRDTIRSRPTWMPEASWGPAWRRSSRSGRPSRNWPDMPGGRSRKDGSGG